MESRATSTLSGIENDAALNGIPAIAAYLQRHLGQRVTAYLSGLKDQKMVGQWAKGSAKPRDVADLRLRHGYKVCRLVVERFGDDTAKAWLFGSNSQLDGSAPALVLRRAELPEEVEPVVRAAAGFVETGARPESSHKVKAAEAPAVVSSILQWMPRELVQRFREDVAASREAARPAAPVRDEDAEATIAGGGRGAAAPRAAAPRRSEAASPRASETAGEPVRPDDLEHLEQARRLLYERLEQAHEAFEADLRKLTNRIES